MLKSVKKGPKKQNCAQLTFLEISTTTKLDNFDQKKLKISVCFSKNVQKSVENDCFKLFPGAKLFPANIQPYDAHFSTFFFIFRTFTFLKKHRFLSFSLCACFSGSVVTWLEREIAPTRYLNRRLSQIWTTWPLGVANSHFSKVIFD